MLLLLLWLTKARLLIVTHQLLIEDLYNMHVPIWLLLILISYLTERSMVLNYKGASSSPQDLPGSSPQGAFLGIFFFSVKYNGAALRPHIPRILLKPACTVKRTKCKTVNCEKHAKEMHAVYVDDLSEAEAVELDIQPGKERLTRRSPRSQYKRHSRMSERNP